jgi:Xaa-Pro aminopeptidase
VTSLVNIRYLTGFTGSNAFLLAGPDGGVFVTDGRYGEIAGELLSGLTDVELVVYTSGLNDTLATAIGSAPDLDLEADHVSWSFVRTLGEHVTAELHATTGVVETLRRVKDADEIAALRRSADAGDAAFSALDALLSDATTEGELGLALIDAMRRAGGEAADWPPIVAVGANAARPHHRSGEGALADGLLLMDWSSGPRKGAASSGSVDGGAAPSRPAIQAARGRRRSVRGRAVTASHRPARQASSVRSGEVGERIGAIASKALA